MQRFIDSWSLDRLNLLEAIFFLTYQMMLVFLSQLLMNGRKTVS